METRYLRSKNVTMMDFSTCIEVLCEKCHAGFFFWIMILKIVTRRI